MHLFTQSALLRALGWSLFDSLWQMALLWLLYGLFTTAFQKASAHFRHGLAVVLLGIGTIWCFGSFIANYAYPADRLATGEWILTLLQRGESTGFPPNLLRGIDQLLPFLSCLYLLALGTLSIRYSRHYYQAGQLKRTGLSRISPALRLFVSETSRRIGIRKEVSVWMSSLVEGPVTLGFLKPVILVPIATLNNLTTTQVEAILLHELAHIKRYDYLLNLGVMVLENLFFFNPFSRSLIRNIRREREHRCDDLVMQFRYDPHTYVSALLSLATHGQSRERLALAASGKNDQLLLQRVKRMLKHKNAGTRPGMRSVLFLFSAVLTIIVSLSRSGVPFARPNPMSSSPGSSPAPLSSLEYQTKTIVSNEPPAEEKWQALEPGRSIVSKPGVIKSIVKTKSLHLVIKTGPEIHEIVYLAAHKEAAEETDEEDADVESATLVGPMMPDLRETSISPRLTMTAPPAITHKEEPFVPNSSFTFRYQVRRDTLQPGLRLASLERSARLEIESSLRILANSLRQLQSQLRTADRTLQTLEPGETSLINLQKQKIQQLRIQLQQQQCTLTKELQDQKRRATTPRVIVHI